MTAPEPSRHASGAAAATRPPMTLLPLTVLLVVTALPYLGPPWPVNHDCAWYLHAAGRLLDGERLYVDIVDVNPPLVLYAAAVPVALARWLALPVIEVFTALVLAAIAVSLLLSAIALGRLARRGDVTHPGLLLATQGYVLVAGAGPDFGQREHLLLLAILPWLWTVAARRAGAPPPAPAATAAGLLAGLGVALKPLFVLAPLLVLATARRRQRSWRTPEAAALGAVLVLYAAHFAVLPADVTAGLLHTTSLAWQAYGSYRAGPWTLLATPALLEGAVLAAVFALVPGARAAGLRELAAAQTTLLLVAVGQGKGWSYHFLPALGLGWVAVASAALHAPATALRRRAAARLCGAMLVAGSALWVVARDPSGGSLRLASAMPADPGGAERLATLAKGAPVLLLDTDIDSHYRRLLRAGLRSASRYACLWPLPALLQHPDAGAEHALRTALLADLRHHDPRLLVVHRPPLGHVPDPGFDVLQWVLADPAFARACGPLQRVGEDGPLIYLARR